MMSDASSLVMLLGLFGLEVVDPDLVGHAAAIALPGAELAEDAIVDQLGFVGRIVAEAAARQGQAASGRPPSMLTV